VVAHGNTLRALVKLMDGVSDADSFHLDLPSACPLVYDLDADLKPIGAVHGYWGACTSRQGRFLMSDELVSAAQAAMGQQCLQDIAVSTVDGAGQPAVATCEASTPSETGESKITTVTQGGRSYRLRERPPSYFALESERIRTQAKMELDAMPVKWWRRWGPWSGRRPTDAPVFLPKAKLVLVRHGYSEYNMENLFTGWADCDLTNRGKEEARFAGSLLQQAFAAEPGVTMRLEKVYTSYLQRAIKTAWLMLDEMELQWVPVEYTWRLNERHYGALQGRDKRQCAAAYGTEQVQKWRRGIRHSPPPWSAEMAESVVDRRYQDVPVPESESLADCAERLQPFLDDTLWPAMREAAARAEAEGDTGAVPTFLVASSENLIRTLVAKLDGVSEDDVPLLDVPYATPLVFNLDAEMRPIASDLAVHPLRYGAYLGDAERIKEVQQTIRDAVVCTPKEGGSDGAKFRGDDDDDDAPCDALGENCFEEEEDGRVKWVCDEPQPKSAAQAATVEEAMVEATEEEEEAAGVVRPVGRQALAPQPLDSSAASE